MKLLVVVVLSVVVAGALAQTDCSAIKAGQNTWNLGGLPSMGPFTGKDASGQYTFTYSVCTALAAKCPNAGGGGTSRCDQPNVAAVCQTWNSAGTAYSACCGETSVVSYSAYSQGADNGLTILYENGDNCVICNPEPRATAINIVCDSTIGWDKQPTLTSIVPATPPSPQYTINIRHVAGCFVGAPGYVAPSGGGISPGSVLLIITLVGFAVYVMVGMIVNKFVRHQEGAAIFPNSEFWGGLPSLVKDGFMFIIHKCRGTTPNTYRPVEG